MKINAKPNVCGRVPVTMNLNKELILKYDTHCNKIGAVPSKRIEIMKFVDEFYKAKLHDPS